MQMQVFLSIARACSFAFAFYKHIVLSFGKSPFFGMLSLVALDSGYGASRCRVIKECCGDQWTAGGPF